METIELGLGETLYRTRTPGGLNVVVLPRRGYLKKYVAVTVEYGSIHLDFYVGDQQIRTPPGIAHFLEHKMFEKARYNISDRFSGVGASSNAFTSHTNTTYLFSTIDNLDECIDLLAELVLTLYLTEDSVEKEKSIIEQEIHMYEDNPSWKCLENLLFSMYTSHPVRFNIAGTVESIRSITKETLTRCYERFYRPNNMVVFASGDLDPQRVTERITCAFEGYARTNGTTVETSFEGEPEGVRQALTVFQMETPISLCALGFKDTDLGLSGRQYVMRELCSDLLLESCFGKSSDRYNEWYEKGLINNRFAAFFLGHSSFGTAVLRAESMYPRDLYSAILEAVDVYLKHGVPRDSFDRLKKKYTGSFINLFNSLEALAQAHNEYFLYDATLADYLKVLDSITVYHVNERLARLFRQDNHVYSIVEKGE
ncbi:MAG: EF-P 5-aminopentanol modification-associated protein YfmH [Bacillota bacterium]